VDVSEITFYAYVLTLLVLFLHLILFLSFCFCISELYILEDNIYFVSVSYSLSAHWAFLSLLNECVFCMCVYAGRHS